MKDLSEAKSLLNKAETALQDAQQKLGKAEETRKAASDELSRAETNKKVADFALTRNRHNKAWLILTCIGAAIMLAAVVIALYWQKSPDVHSFYEGFTYNGEPIFLTSIGGTVLVVGLIFLFVKLSQKGKLEAAAKASDDEYERVKSVYDEADNASKAAQSAVNDARIARDRAEKEYLESDPEEMKRREEEKKARDAEALEELRRIEEINQKAAEDAKKKAADRLEADKMFEHPQAYVLDGKYEDEYAVFRAAADMGSPEAQERVIRYMLGMNYKAGLKPDVKAGEEKALQYASENTAMYELLGKGFLYGEGDMPKDEQKGLTYLERAATKGRQNAMIMTAICYYNGVGTEKDEERALSFFKKAAKQGNEQAIKVVLAMEAGQKLRF